MEDRLAHSEEAPSHCPASARVTPEDSPETGATAYRGSHRGCANEYHDVHAQSEFAWQPEEPEDLYPGSTDRNSRYVRGPRPAQRFERELHFAVDGHSQ